MKNRKKNSKPKKTKSNHIFLIIIICLCLALLFFLIYKKYIYKPSSNSSPIPTPPTYTNDLSKIKDVTILDINNKQTVLSALEEVNAAISAIQNSPSRIISIFGKSGEFFISGQASMPSVTSKIGNVTGVTSISQAVNSSPNGTKVFVYNPQKSMVDYYSDAGVKITSLATGTLTVGSTTY